MGPKPSKPKSGLTFNCVHCDKIFDSQAKLDKHERDHKKRPYQCDECPKAYTSDQGLKKHIAQTHMIKKFVCKVCGKKYAEKSFVERHEKEHEGKPFMCSVCLRLFDTEEKLKTHEPFAHALDAQGRPVPPPPPNDQAPDPAKPYLCDECGAWLRTARAWTDHKATHRDTTVFCDACNKPYISEKALKEHKKIRHGPKRFKCAYCKS